jgi:hypothetical protein
MPVTCLKHQIDAYTIEASGTPVATIKATSVLDAMRFVLDGFPDLTGWWDGEEPFAIRNANWLEKDELLLEVKRREEDRDDEHFVYWHSREATRSEESAILA